VEIHAQTKSYKKVIIHITNHSTNYGLQHDSCKVYVGQARSDDDSGQGKTEKGNHFLK